MRKYFVFAVVLLVFAGVVFAQDRDGRDEGRRKPRGDGGDRKANMGQRLQEELGLTENQAKQFRQIMETQRQAMQNWQKENGEAMKGLQKQMKEAMQAGEKDKAQSIREKMKEQFAGRREIQEGLAKRLGDVLTADQMAKFKKLSGQRQGGKGGKDGRDGGFRHPIFRTLMMLRRAELTEEQQEKVKKTLDQAVKKILHEVLTPEQRKKLKDMEKGGGGDRPDRGERGGDRGGARDRPRRGDARRPRGGNPDAVEVTPEK